MGEVFLSGPLYLFTPVPTGRLWAGEVNERASYPGYPQFTHFPGRKWGRKGASTAGPAERTLMKLRGLGLGSDAILRAEDWWLLACLLLL